jgi:hypothetical protein
LDSVASSDTSETSRRSSKRKLSGISTGERKRFTDNPKKEERKYKHNNVEKGSGKKKAKRVVSRTIRSRRGIKH